MHSPVWRHAQRRSAPRSRGLIPCWRIQRLAVGIDGRLHVLGEVGIGHWRVAEILFISLRPSDALAAFPARSWRRLDDGHRTVGPLYDPLGAVLHLGKHAVEIAGKFGLRNADRCHIT